MNDETRKLDQTSKKEENDRPYERSGYRGNINRSDDSDQVVGIRGQKEQCGNDISDER